MNAPSERLLVIEPSPRWRPIDLGEVWRYRELLYFFVWRDVKVRYKQTVLGIAWAVIQPLLATLIFAFFFGRVAKLPSDGIPYPLFAYAGLLPWTFFANAFVAGSMSVLAGSHLITKVYFPRVLVPIASVITGLFDFAVALVMIVPLLFLWRTVPSPAALLGVPAAMLTALLIVVGLTFWTSALVVRFRDLRHVVPFVAQVWMFATPIIYPASMIPERWRWVVHLNPMASVVEAFRGSLFATNWSVAALSISAAVGVALIVSGSMYFRYLERIFADVV